MGSIAYADITQAPAPLPSAKLQVLKPGLSLQPPLTRLGTGPGLILLTTPEVYDEKLLQRDDAPTAVLKWAEEGYAVFQIAAEAAKFQESLVDMLAQIGDVLPRFRIYERLFKNHERLLVALSAGYLDILRFCIASKDLFVKARKSKSK